MNGIINKRLEEINRSTIDRSNMFYWQTDRPISIKESETFFGANRGKDLDDELIEAVNIALPNNHVVSISGGEHFDIGSVNVNRRFVLDNNKEIIGRFHPKSLRNGYFSVEYLLAKTALENNIPAAKPIIVHYTKSNEDFDFILFEKIEGDNMKFYLAKHPEEEKKLLEIQGGLMAKMHNIKVDGFGFFDNKQAGEGMLQGIHTSNRDHVLSALSENIDVIINGGYINRKQGKQIISLLHESQLLECEQASLIHNDAADWNVIVKSKSELVFIDWDESFAGDPIADIACWALFFPIERLELLLNGYRKEKELPSDFEEILHIYRLRYVVSKMCLRHKKISYNKTELLENAIKSALEILKLESEYFEL